MTNGEFELKPEEMSVYVDEKVWEGVCGQSLDQMNDQTNKSEMFYSSNIFLLYLTVVLFSFG